MKNYQNLYEFAGFVSSPIKFEQSIEEILEFKKTRDEDIESIILGSMSLSIDALVDVFGTYVIDPVTFDRVGYHFDEKLESFVHFLSRFISHEILDDGEPAIMYYHRMRSYTYICHAEDVVRTKLLNNTKEIKAKKFIARFVPKNFQRENWFIPGNSKNIATTISDALYDAKCRKLHINEKNSALSMWGKEFTKLWMES